MHATGVGFVYASWFVRGKKVSELVICVNVLALGSCWFFTGQADKLVRPTPADSLSVSLKRAANTFSLLSVSVSVPSNTPHPTPHAVYDT
jgi:hypothetical protein